MISTTNHFEERAPMTEPFHVLIVDDEPAIGEILSEVLAAPNRTITVFDSAQAALDALDDNPVELAFLDANLPGVSGLELADRIRKNCPQAHIVICSGYVGPELALQKSAGRIDEALQKPVDLSDVARLANSYATD